MSDEEPHRGLEGAAQDPMTAAAVVAASVDVQLPAAASLYDYEKALRATVRASAADDPRRPHLLAELEVVQWRLRPSDELVREQDRDELPFVPLFTLKGAEERAAVLDGGTLSYLGTRLGSVTLPSLRARLLDALFVFGGKAQVDDVITAYLGAACAAPHELHGVPHLARALALAVGRRPRDDVEQAVRVFLEAFRIAKSGFLRELVAAARPYLQRNKALGAEFLVALLAVADDAAVTNGAKRILERAMLGAAVDVADAVRDKSGLKDQLRRRVAASFEHEADERSADGSAVVFLQFALKAYQDLGDGSAVSRLKRRVHESGIQATARAKSFVVEGSVSMEELEAEIDDDVRWAAGRSPHEHLARLLACGIWLPWSEVLVQVDNARGRFGHMHIPAVVFTHDGRPTAPVATEEEEVEAQRRRWYVEHVRVVLQFLTPKVRQLRRRGLWSAPLVAAFLAEGVAFSDEELSAVRPGLVDFEEGRFWSALHVLMPQIERVLRTLGNTVLADTRSFKSDTQALQWASLTQLLRNEEMQKLLDGASPGFAKELFCLLVDSTSGNLRDDLAHGILSPNGSFEAHCLLVILILLMLAGFRPTAGAQPSS